MTGRFINLTDGTRIEIKVNFGTIYHLNKCGGDRVAKRIENRQNNGKEPDNRDVMDFVAKFIYASLRSNGRDVTFDEALSLMPVDVDEIIEITKAYQEEMERLKKKQTSRMTMKQFTAK